MKIFLNPIYMQSPSFLSQKTSLVSSANSVFDTTEFMRGDFDIDGIINLMNKLYKNEPKLDVLFYACSIGKEVYSFDLRLKSFFKGLQDKEYSLIAKDINPDLVLKAKRGVYKISDQEEDKLFLASNNNLYRYIDIIDDGLEKFAKIRDSLKTNIHFATADICKDIDNISDDTRVLIARNFWQYIKPEEQIKLVEKISKKLKQNSLFVLGEFDKIYGLDRLLKQRGFGESGVKNVLIKLAR